MSESVKPRFAVDLGQIERQLGKAGSPQAQPVTATRSDPLAELARIVGQEDPFQAILAHDATARPRQQASAIDDLFARRDIVTPAARQRQPQAHQNEFEAPDYDLDGYAPQSEAPRSNAQAYAYQQPTQARQDSYNDGAYGGDYYEEGAADGYGSAHYPQPEPLDYPQVQKPRTRKGFVAIGAIAAAIVIGGTGAYMLTRSTAGAGGAPILVQATADPVKVQPQNPGGVEIPNQNKQIYERTQQNTDATKVVNREEQPVDVKQAVRMNGSGTSVADATGATVPGAPAQTRGTPNGLNLGEPRKVRTVTIRPDGTLAGAPDSAPAARSAPPPSPVPAMTLPAAAAAQPAAVQTASAQPRPASATPVAAASTPAPKPTPVAATPAATPQPQRVASAQPMAAPAVPSDTTTSGGFAVQLGLANSEDAATSAFSSYQRKYPDLAGMPSLIRKAEVNGNTIYRVRVGPMSKDEASSLCSKLQGQGGQCFVAKN